jgi:hypothetical protein
MGHHSPQFAHTKVSFGSSTTMIDLKIANRLNGEGIAITARGVKRARLAQGLRRRNNYPAKQAQQQEAMRQAIAKFNIRE